MTRFIRISDWDPVRSQFTEEERAAMNAAIVSVVICPRGGVVDMDKLPKALREKIAKVLP